uniref:POTRA domain-containing protein n=1 Tax=candidate division WOR-3 bacterium TaxID=2052148 RepID=A0A7V0Z7Y7_UNCW3
MAALSISILSIAILSSNTGEIEIEIEGNTFFSSEYLLSFYRPIKSYNGVEIFIKKILDLYCNAGFPFCRINPEVINTGDKKDKLILHINEGERTVIKDYLFKTSRKTETGPLRKIARIKKDEYFSLKNLNRIKMVILKTNAFSDITETILKHGEDYFILLEIKEKSTDYISAGGAFAQNEKYLSFELYSLNIFGTLRQFRFNYESNMSDRYDKRFLNINFTEPVFLFPVIFDAGIQIYSYDSARLSELNANFNTPLNEYLNIIVTSGIEITGYLTDTGSYGYKHTLLGAGLEWNFRNEGLFFLNNVKFDYLMRNNERIRFFFDGEIGYANIFIKPHYRFVKTEHFEYFDYIKIGGAKTLRGYMEDEFLVKQALWLNIEYKRLPVYPLIDIAYLDNNYTFAYGAGFEAKTNVVNASIIFAMPEKGSWNGSKIHILLEKNL